jgi:disulfide bond formation protein DsbB
MTILRPPRRLLVLGGGFSLSLVVGGIFLAEFLGLAACPLCIWQRMLYLLFALLAFFAQACTRLPQLRRLMVFLMAGTASAGVGVAGYQVWIQRFAPQTTCGGKEPWWEVFVSWAGEWMPLLFKASGLCSDPAWKFLTLSIADWSLLCFCGLLALSLRVLARLRPR